MKLLPVAIFASKNLLPKNSPRSAFQLRKISAASKIENDSTDSDKFSQLANRASNKKVEKIMVKVNLKDGTSKNLLMNKDISTPFHCALHISKGLADSSALCIVRNEGGSEEISPMRLPLSSECSIEFVSLQSKEYAEEVNQAYWRSCSVLLGSLLSSSFSSPLQPIGSVQTKYSDGYFGYDVKGKNLEGWNPSPSDFSSLVLSMHSKMIEKNLPFDTLLIDEHDAAVFPLGQRYTSESLSMLCRIGDHVESIDGPVISHAGQIGRFAILKASSKSNGIWRFSGVSLPSSQSISSHNWQIITDYARKIAP